MREILFRGKSNYGNVGEWEYGLVSQPHVIENGIVTSYYFTKLCEDGHSSRRTVSANTIGQYTGLTDKNGKKIFDVDIVKIYLCEPNGLANYEIGYIKNDDAKARYVFCTEEGIYGIDNSNVFEVIGNIHDNPELLKGGEQG